MHQTGRPDFRLTDEEVRGDPVCMVVAQPCASTASWYPPEEDPNTVWVPEAIMWRIIGVARAYQLNFSNHLQHDLSARTVFRFAQLDYLEDELTFLCDLLNDSVLVAYVEKILRIVSYASQRRNQLEVGVERP